MNVIRYAIDFNDQGAVGSSDTSDVLLKSLGKISVNERSTALSAKDNVIEETGEC